MNTGETAEWSPSGRRVAAPLWLCAKPQHSTSYVAAFSKADIRMKLTGEEYDGRIVEVTWDPERQGWRMFRFRDDKPHGNHAKTVRSVLNSIKDGVEIADVSGLFLSLSLSTLAVSIPPRS